MKNSIFINDYYLNNDSKIQFAIKYIKNADFSQIKDGKLEFANGIWANVQTYLTKEDALFEAHRKYIDIQYIISGNELIQVAEYSTCLENIPYDDNNDIEFLNCTEYEQIVMNTGDYLLLYPSDAHKPSISIENTPTSVRKIVFKIPIDTI